MTTAIIVYLLISCLMVYYFWSDIGWKKNSWRPYIFYLVIFLFWPIIFFIGIVYAIKAKRSAHENSAYTI